MIQFNIRFDILSLFGRRKICRFAEKLMNSISKKQQFRNSLGRTRFYKICEYINCACAITWAPSINRMFPVICFKFHIFLKFSFTVFSVLFFFLPSVKFVITSYKPVVTDSNEVVVDNGRILMVNEAGK